MQPWSVRSLWVPAAIGAAVATSTASFLALAGPLDPPAGPVTSTNKTLSDVEPRIAISSTNTPGDADSIFKITQPGSYYLTGNITGVVGKHGIEIASSGVKLDLNGFDLLGVADMGAFDGVNVSLSDLTSIAVINGSVRNWGDEGVDLGTVPVTNGRVADLRASGNAGFGIRVGYSAAITNCSAESNAGLYGIAASQCATITNCTAYRNGGSGINAGAGSTVTTCAARFNTTDGIICSTDCVILNNSCSGNGLGGTGAGIHATGADNRIEGNNCTANDRGINVNVAGNVIIRNTCAGNTDANWIIAANNVFGPIIDRINPGSSAVNGNAAPDSTGSTHPNANFSY